MQERTQVQWRVGGLTWFLSLCDWKLDARGVGDLSSMPSLLKARAVLLAYVKMHLKGLSISGHWGRGQDLKGTWVDVFRTSIQRY